MPILATAAAAEEEESKATPMTCPAQGETKESIAVVHFFTVVKMLSNSSRLHRIISLPKLRYLFLPGYIQTSESARFT